LVPKLAALTFLYLWLTGMGTVSAGKLGLTFGVLALFDALTLASLRKGSAVEWSDLSLLVSALLGPMVLPLYATAAIGVITLGTDEAPAVKRLLGSPGTERLASAAPSRFTGPNRSSTGAGQPNPPPSYAVGANSSANASGNPGMRPMPPGMPQRMGAPPVPNGASGLTAPGGVSPARPPFGSAPRPSVSSNQRPITKEVMPPSPTPAAPQMKSPAPSAPTAGSSTPPPTSTGK
jgi:hypothetical protein